MRENLNPARRREVAVITTNNAPKPEFVEALFTEVGYQNVLAVSMPVAPMRDRVWETKVIAEGLPTS